MFNLSDMKGNESGSTKQYWDGYCAGGLPQALPGILVSERGETKSSPPPRDIELSDGSASVSFVFVSLVISLSFFCLR